MRQSFWYRLERPTGTNAKEAAILIRGGTFGKSFQSVPKETLCNEQGFRKDNPTPFIVVIIPKSVAIIYRIHLKQ